MPQFDITTFPSQIFWFVICFVALYSFLAFKILPRIRSIIEDRKSVMDGDLNDFKKLEDDIAKVQGEADSLMKNAEVGYKKSIAEAVKEANLLKELSLEKFKGSSQKIVDKSQKEIDKLVADSKESSDKLAADLSGLIEKKIFN